MRKLFNLLRGYVELTVTGAFPERLLNLCAQNRMQFWRLQWLDETSFIFRVHLQDRKRLDELAQRAMCQLDERGRRGATVVAQGMTKRWGFLLGLALCLVAVSVLSRFLLVVEVVGNQQVPAAVILSQLHRLGLRPGVYGPGINEKEVSNAALLALPELSYMAINLYGTRAEVVVHEADQLPELLDETVPADVVAEADGIIVDIRADTGRPLFADGDVVAKGEVLITGEIDLLEPEGSTVDMGYLMVHAAGTVTARTWRTLEETVPLTNWVKEYTGEERTLRSLDLLWGRIDFFQNSSIYNTRYDKIVKNNQWSIFGCPLPAGITTTTLRGYTLREEEVDQEEETARLEQLLLYRLNQLMAANQGEVLRTDFTARVEGGLLTVTLLAECQEEIGRTVERPGKTGRVEGNNPAPMADQ